MCIKKSFFSLYLPAVTLFFTLVSSGISGKTPKVSIGMFKGTPALLVDGNPNSGMTYMTYRPQERYFHDFGNAGVDFVSFAITANSYPGSTKPVWVSQDSFDFSLMDERMNFILRANPNALIFPRVYLFAPQWWMEQNPDELMVYHDGTKLKPIRGGTRTTLPAWASEKWRNATAYCLRKMIDYIKSKPYGDHVVGYHLASGGTDEWYYYPNYKWFFNETMEDFLDYSLPQTEAFRRYLRDKYKTVNALQSAWHNNSVTFENALIAPKKDKLKPDFFLFFDPAKSQHVIDSFDFEAEIVAETIAYFCRVVKEKTNGEAFTGAFYGYVTGAVDKVYCATHKLLQSPYIDFLTSPSDYSFREPGSGYSTYRTLAKSVQIHKKLWWDENDYYTYLTPEWKWVEGWTGPRDFKTTETQQLRQLSNQITNASAGWWFDMEGGWFDSPEAMHLIEKLNAIAEKSVFAERSSIAEIAIIVDEKSILYEEMGGILYRPLIMEQRLPVGRIGAPVDWILMDDLGDAPAYKMYVFLNAFHVTESNRQAVKKLPERGAKVLVWVYAPGYAGTSLDVTGCYDITGLKLKCLRDKGPLHVEISETGEKTFPGMKKGEKYGTENKIGPVFVGDDPTTTVLGTLYGYGEPGLLYKRTENVDTYYSSVPKLPSNLLRGIAEKAGVHIYDADDDVLYVNKSFVAIHTPWSGKRTLRFLKSTNLYDVYNEKTIAEKERQVILDLPARTTVLCFMGSEQEWKTLRGK